MRPRSQRILRCESVLILVLACLSPAGAQAQNQPSFQGLGNLGGVAGNGLPESSAAAISADGLVVVGSSQNAAGNREAFRWTSGGGMVGLGDVAGGLFYSEAAGVSGDGQVVVGTGVDGDDEFRPFRWNGAITALDPLSCTLCPNPAQGLGVSGNGLVAVGTGLTGSLFGGVMGEAVRWTGGGTSDDPLDHLPGPQQVSVAKGADFDGSVIVGESDSSSGNQAFKSLAGGALIGLGFVPGAQSRSTASAVSADGAIIVGAANTSTTGSNQLEAAMWSDGNSALPGTLTLLGQLPGTLNPGSQALAVSSDGAVVVGCANDPNTLDVAFLWDAVNGMRDLEQVLQDEYGLDLSGWTLEEATGVSDVNGAGEFSVVGTGLNPAGETEAWLAFLSPVACNDGIDNDSDFAIDFPADPECNSLVDRSEGLDCADGLDNDADFAIDFPGDPECNSAQDPSEEPDCSDGVDNDGDLAADFPVDPGCRDSGGLVEDPACDNGIDDDLDLATDFPADSACVAADDASEIADCNDGLDNDGDLATDYPADADCDSLSDLAEDAECNDRLDNDGDGQLDFPFAYPGCVSVEDALEAPQCSDGVDNDGDLAIDFPADGGCSSESSATESPVVPAPGDLLVADRDGRHLFLIDPASGLQQEIVSDVQLTSPEGLALRKAGRAIVADPAGLFEVDLASGAQRRFSDPLSSTGSLQVVIDANLDPVVLEVSEISTVSYVTGGLGVGTTLIDVMTQPSLAIFLPYALARESSGDLLFSAFGIPGDGIYRSTPDGVTVSALTPGFNADRWEDLALESQGQIVAAGMDGNLGAGVFRIDPVSGTTTTLNNDGLWAFPVAIAVGPQGELYVGDQGTCSDGTCSGAAVVQLDPLSGARLHTWSGGFITGRTDLQVVVPEPGRLLLVATGLAALLGLARLRRRS